jgi:hypothetical protein
MVRRPKTMVKGGVNDEELDPNQHPEIEMRVAKHRRGLVDSFWEHCEWKRTRLK